MASGYALRHLAHQGNANLQNFQDLTRPGGGGSLCSGRFFTHGSLLLKTAQSSAGWGVNQRKNYSLADLTPQSHFR